MKDAPTDAALMLRAARNDEAAFAELVQRHQTGLVNFFRRMGDYTHAEDLAQNTWVRLYRYRRRYRPRAKFTTFLYLLARRVWIDHLRSSERRAKLRERAAAEAPPLGPEGCGALEDAKARVRAALDGLNEDKRAMVILSVYQGFKYREIAAMLDIPLGTVKTRMYHAIRQLREALTHDDQSS